MKRILLTLCVLLFAGALVGCQPSAEEQQMEAVDDAIHRLERVFPSFYTLGAAATPSSIRTAAQRLSAEWEATVAAAEGLTLDHMDEAAEAHAALVAAVEGLPEDGEGHMAQIMPLFEAFKASVDDVHEAGDFH